MDYCNGCRDDMDVIPDIRVYWYDLPITRDGTVFRTHIAGLDGWNSGIDYSCTVAER